MPGWSHAAPSFRVSRAVRSNRSTNGRRYPWEHLTQRELLSVRLCDLNVPVVLNTSFNHHEPIVQRPEEAIACYLRTKMDVLVAGNFYSSREQLLLPANRYAELQAAE